MWTSQVYGHHDKMSVFNFQLLKGLLEKMLNYCLGTVNENHWGFKPVFLVIFGENSHLNDIVCTIANFKICLFHISNHHKTKKG